MRREIALPPLACSRGRRVDEGRRGFDKLRRGSLQPHEPRQDIFLNLRLRDLSKTDNLQNIEPEAICIVEGSIKRKAVSYRGPSKHPLSPRKASATLTAASFNMSVEASGRSDRLSRVLRLVLTGKTHAVKAWIDRSALRIRVAVSFQPWRGRIQR